jgi:class 3 adenylate cyclase
LGRTKKAPSNASKRCVASSSIRKISEHHGRIVKTTGDGMLVEFSKRRERIERQPAAIAASRAQQQQSSQCRDDVGMCEVVALEQQRLTCSPRERIREAIAEI